MRSTLATRIAPLTIVVVIFVLLRAWMSPPPGAPAHGLGRPLLLAAIALWTLVLPALWHARGARAAGGSGRLPADAAALATALKLKVIGRDALCDELAAQAYRRVALHARSRPVGVYVFAGASGVGKAHVAKSLAGVLARPVVRLDMGASRQAADAHAGLFGRTKGLTGAGRSGRITGTLREQPDAVFVFEDFEQTRPEVQKALLAAWNDGVVVDPVDGEAVSTTQALFVLSTTVVIDQPAGLAVHGLGAGFTQAVLDRVDRVFVFPPLGADELAQVSEREVRGARGPQAATRDLAGPPPSPIWRTLLAAAIVATLAALVVRAVEPRLAREAGEVLVPRPAPSSPFVADDVPADQALPAAAAPSNPAPPAASYAEELRNRAQCHPGLARAPAVPSIALAGVTRPDADTLKYRFWVDGAGRVVRDELIGGQLGTPAERDAAQRYLHGQRYEIPDVGDCRARSEIELIATFFLARNGGGSWQTLVAVHPRWWFDDSGQLRESN